MLCRFRPGVELAQLIVHIGVSRDSGTDVDPDGRGVDQLDMPDAFRVDLLDMVGHFLSVAQRIQRGDQAFQDQRGLSGTRNTGNDCQPTFGDFHGERLDGVDAVCLQADHPICKQLPP